MADKTSSDDTICELCDGCGEISSAKTDKIGDVSCPTCVSRELHEQIDRLRAGRSNSQRVNDAGAREIARLRSALEFIADIPSGSKGAYAKFKQAQERAEEALA